MPKYPDKPKPLKKRQNKNGQKKVRKLEIRLNRPSTSSAAIKAFFLPCMSARQPQKYAPRSMPKRGTAFNKPLSDELRLKSHCAEGRTKDTTLTDMAQFM